VTRSQVAWLLTAAVGIALFIATTSASWPVLHTICRFACHSGQPNLATARTLHSLGISLNVFAIFSIGRDVVVRLIWLGVAGLIILHRPRDRGPVVAAFFLLLFTMNAENAVAVPPALQPLEALTNAASGVALTLFGFLFPDGRFVPRWTRWIALGSVIDAVIGLLPRSPISDGLGVVGGPLWVITVLTILASQVYRYRSASSPEQRQQTKWVLFGLGVSLGGILLLNLGYGVIPGAPKNGSLYDIASYTDFPLFTAAIPISIGIAMLRSRLWDVDRVINRTLVYGSLTLSLGALYLGGVILAEALTRTLTGQHSDVAIAVVTLAVTALFNPWRRRLQAFIDRRFYRRKYDASRILTAFSANLRDEVDLEQLSGDIAAVVQETMQPASLSLWVRQPGGEA